MLGELAKKMKIINQLLRGKVFNVPLANLEAFLKSTPQGPQKLATVLSEGKSDFGYRPVPTAGDLTPQICDPRLG